MICDDFPNLIFLLLSFITFVRKVVRAGKLPVAAVGYDSEAGAGGGVLVPGR